MKKTSLEFIYRVLGLYGSFAPPPSKKASKLKESNRHFTQTSLLPMRHCREILFTRRYSPSTRELGSPSTSLYDVRLRHYGALSIPNICIFAYLSHIERLNSTFLYAAYRS